MATVSNGGSIWNTTAGTKGPFVTPATAGEVWVVVCANSGRTTAQPPTVTDDNNGVTNTYTQVASATKNTSADSIWVFIRDTPIAVTDPTGTSLTMTQSGDTGGGYLVYRITGMGGRTAAYALRQTNSQNNAAAGTPSITLGQAVLTGNVVIGAVMNGTNGSTTTAPPTSWTENHDAGYNAPASGLEVCHRASGETNTTIAWTAASASAFGAVVVEIDVSAPVPPPELPGGGYYGANGYG